MNIENTKAQMRKGVLEFCILSVLKKKMPTHRKY
jgi:PadR family transcriptional regulator PadR